MSFSLPSLIKQTQWIKKRRSTGSLARQQDIFIFFAKCTRRRWFQFFLNVRPRFWTNTLLKKNSKKTYYGKMILQTTQTYYFKRLFSYPKHFCKFFRISNALKQQRFSHKLKASAKIFKQTSLANIISYPVKSFSSSTLFIKVIKIIHKHDRLLRYTTLLACWKFVINRTRSHGRRNGEQGGLGLPWILKFSAKTVFFLILSVVKIEFNHFWHPLEKFKSVLRMIHILHFFST